MRRFLALALGLGVIAGAVLGARATTAHGVLPPPGPDQGVAGGGYTLVDPALPNVPSNRARFEFALREYPVRFGPDGLTRGKPLVVRVTGFDLVTKFVLRSWPQETYPMYLPGGFPGWPPPVPGAEVQPCSVLVSPPVGSFGGMAAVFEEVLPGLEVPFVPMPMIEYGVMVTDVAEPGAGFDMFDMVGPTAPFPLPSGTLVSGNIKLMDGVNGC